MDEWMETLIFTQLRNLVYVFSMNKDEITNILFNDNFFKILNNYFVSKIIELYKLKSALVGHDV